MLIEVLALFTGEPWSSTLTSHHMGIERLGLVEGSHKVLHLIVMLIEAIIPVQQTVNFQDIAVGIIAFPRVNASSVP
jgi:hypothetical protein